MAFVIVFVVVWLVWAMVAARLARSPWGSVECGLLYVVVWLYARVVHRLRIEGLEHIPAGRSPGPLIVVANHTAGVDPLLINAAWPRVAIRFVMAQDMRVPGLEWFWSLVGIIFVERNRGSMVGVREALGHLREGGVLGVFPEGGIASPRETLGVFHPGIGMFIRYSRARVLPCVIRGTPVGDSAWASLTMVSHSVVRFYPVISYEETTLSDADIAADLRVRFAAWTGWPLVEETHTD